MLKMYANTDQDNWDVVLPLVTYAYNTGLHSATKYSPYEMLYGREPRTPLEAFMYHSRKAVKDSSELVSIVNSRIRRIEKVVRDLSEQDVEKGNRNKLKRLNKLSLKAGDLVMRKRMRLHEGEAKGLAPQYDGPHRVVYAPVDAPTVVLRMFDNPDPDAFHDKVSIEQLKKYYPPVVFALEEFEGCIGTMEVPSVCHINWDIAEEWLEPPDTEIKTL
jgi:hypothetical protein